MNRTAMQNMELSMGNETCHECGRPKSEHGVDPMTGRQTKCPVHRQEDSSPRADY